MIPVEIPNVLWFDGLALLLETSQILIRLVTKPVNGGGVLLLYSTVVQYKQ